MTPHRPDTEVAVAVVVAAADPLGIHLSLPADSTMPPQGLPQDFPMETKMQVLSYFVAIRAMVLSPDWNGRPSQLIPLDVAAAAVEPKRGMLATKNETSTGSDVVNIAVQVSPPFVAALAAAEQVMVCKKGHSCLLGEAAAVVVDVRLIGVEHDVALAEQFVSGAAVARPSAE